MKDPERDDSIDAAITGEELKMRLHERLRSKFQI